jgi:soluble lytic murein transglycosylase
VNFSGLNPTVDKLLGLGLYDEAAPEIENSLRKHRRLEGDSLSDLDSDTAFTLAVLYSKGGFGDRSIRFIEPKWKNIPDDYLIELVPREQAELLYPVPFRDQILEYGKLENVDPRFLLAVMRQESRFQADVKSAAAARGLMQFIESTSREISKELKTESFSKEELYNPDTSIRFGSRYLSNLFKEFPGKPQAVAAAYNGGEDRVSRWLKRAQTDDPDRYVPEVVFSQTKDYVYKVMANYRMYTFLYDENLFSRNRPGP